MSMLLRKRLADIIGPANTREGCGERYHCFNLSQSGYVYSPADPAQVRALVELARRCSFCSEQGEHHGLLGQVALREEARRFVAGEVDQLYWNRSTGIGSNETVITLQDWLIEQGQEPELDIGRQFRAAALAAGLTYSDWPNQCGDTKFGHNFNLNTGDIVGMPEPHQVKALIEMAYAYATLGCYGEHMALLGLVADVADVEAFEAGRSQIILWRSSVSEGEGRISLRTWLAANGQVPNTGGHGLSDGPFAHEFPEGVVPEGFGGQGSDIFSYLLGGDFNGGRQPFDFFGFNDVFRLEPSGSMGDGRFSRELREEQLPLRRRGHLDLPGGGLYSFDIGLMMDGGPESSSAESPPLAELIERFLAQGPGAGKGDARPVLVCSDGEEGQPDHASGRLAELGASGLVVEFISLGGGNQVSDGSAHLTNNGGAPAAPAQADESAGS